MWPTVCSRDAPCRSVRERQRRDGSTRGPIQLERRPIAHERHAEIARVTRIARAIAFYVRAHPNAADTASGVAEWWVPQDEPSLEEVEAALDCLIERGAMERWAPLHGPPIYRRRISP